jgi:1-deoxy-D-xylulose 5-phosphate reductoisomerase
MMAGGLYNAVMTAANECAVADFLADRIGFTDIYERIERSLDWASAQGMRDSSYELAEVFEWEKRIRDLWSRNG